MCCRILIFMWHYVERCPVFGVKTTEALALPDATATIANSLAGHSVYFRLSNEYSDLRP